MQGSDFRATDKQQTHSTAACPPIIAPTDLQQGQGSIEEACRFRVFEVPRDTHERIRN